MCPGRCAGYNGCSTTGGGDSGGFSFSSNGGSGNSEKAPLDLLVTSGRGGGGFHSNGSRSSGVGKVGSGDGDGNVDVKKEPPNQLVSETVHGKRADNIGGPALEVEQQDNSMLFPTPLLT